MKKLQHIVWLMLAIVGLSVTHVETAKAQNYDSYNTFTLCKGDSIVYDGQVFKTNGIYDLTYVRVDGTDSVHRIVINFAPSYSFFETKTIREGEVYPWHGQNCTESKTYYDSHKDIHGCDSVYRLDLTVLKFVRQEITIDLCANESHAYHGTTYTEPGVYEQTLPANDGNDTIVRILVRRLSADTVHTNVNISNQQSYTWDANGQTYTQSGVYFTHDKTINGCDSVNVLHLSVWPTFRNDTTAEVCQAEVPFYWHGQGYTAGGTYYDTHKTVHGYDSVYVLNLTVKDIVYQNVALTICSGQTATHNGKIYSAAGEYYDIESCDKAYKITVEEVLPHTYTTVAYFDGVNPYTWAYDNQQYGQPGIYTKTKAIVGTACEDLYVLDLRLGTKFESIEEATICEGDDYEWRGRILGQAGVGQTSVYYDSLKTRHGMDSVYVLKLTVGKKYLMSKQLTVCQGGSVEYDGKTYTEGGTFEYTKQSVLGCDSVIRVFVNVINNYQKFDTVYLNAGETYQFYDRTISTAGDFFQSLGMDHDCESIHSLHVIVRPTTPKPFLYTEQLTLCESELPYYWQTHNKVLTSAGIYYDSLKTKDPNSLFADSVYMLKLDVYPSYGMEKNIVENLYTCQEGGSITYHGKTYTEQDGITDEWVTLHTKHGCDSLVHVFLHFNQHFESHENFTITNQETREWHGLTLNATGDYSVIEKDENGCDKIYYAHVTMENKFIHKLDTTVCYYETPFEWHGLQITRNVGTTTYQAAEGDHQYIINVTVQPQYESDKQLNICDGGSVTFYGQTYTSPGDFDIVLQSVNNCDSIVHVHVNQLPSYHTIDTLYIERGDKIMWGGEYRDHAGIYRRQFTTINGCDSIHELVLREVTIKHDSIIRCATDTPYIWNNKYYYHTTHDEVVRKDRHGRDTLKMVLDLEFKPAYEEHRQFYVCPGSSVSFRNKTYTEAARDTFFLKNIHSCDSLIIVDIYMTESYNIVETAYWREGQPSYMWHGQEITGTGLYMDNLKTMHECDSIFKLIVSPLEWDSINRVQCATDTLNWYGRKLYQTGVFYEFEKDQLNRDSVMHVINLTVNPIFDTVINIKGCKPGNLPMFNGKTYSETGIYYDTLQTVMGGCDSTFTIHATVYEPVHIQYYDTVCENQLPYMFDDEEVWAEGEYSGKRMKNECGCDSTTAVRLTILPTFTRNDSVIIGEGDTYIVGNKQIMAAHPEYKGQPISEDSVLYSCDSTYTFHVIVKQPYDSLLHLCEGDSVRFGAQWINYETARKKKIFYDSIPWQYEIPKEKVLCDSVIRLTIETHPHYINDTLAHISDQDSLYYNKRWLKSSGTYYDTIPTATWGCDSIQRLTLIVDKTYLFRDSIHICQPHDKAYKHTWADGHKQSQKIWKAGVYDDSLRTEVTKDLYLHYPREYRDSIYQLVVTMDKSYYYTRTYDLCEGDSVLLAGKWRHTAGIYVDSLKTSSACHCDSIYQWNVNMIPSYRVDLGSVLISDQETYLWSTDKHPNGQVLQLPGIYYDTLQSIRGCDSIVQIELKVAQTYYIKDSVHICQPKHGKPYVHEFADGHQMTAPAEGDPKNLYIYWDSLKTQQYAPYAHFDSVYHLVVTVEPTPLTMIDTIICRGSSIMFDGQYIDKDGFYYDTIQSLTPLRCDSVIMMRVSYAENYTKNEGEVKIPQGSSYRWHWNNAAGDTVLTTTGVYTTTYPTRYGCDSTFTLKLTVCPIYYFEERDQVCQSELPYRWKGHNKMYNTTGIYYDSLHTVNGFDSIYKLDLLVLDTTHVFTKAVSCAGDSIEFNGRWLKKAGQYTDTLKTTLGCDSIVHLSYQHMSTYLRKQNAITDDKTPYIWHVGEHTHTYATSGVYRDTTQTTEGCDSIVELTLTVGKTYHMRDSLTICQSETPYDWHGWRLSESKTYFDSLQTKLGFDSIYEFKLTVLPTHTSSFSVRLCEGEPYTYNSKTYTRQGQYKDTLKANNGCDSIVTINLSYQPKIHILRYDTISDQQTYTFRNEQLSHSGVYYEDGKQSNGCDSIVELHLTVAPTYHYYDSVAICRNELPYEWQGEKKYYKDSTYIKRYTTVLGYDSIYTLRLHVLNTYTSERQITLCQGESYRMYNGRVITTGGNYYDTLTSVISGCDSIVTLRIRFNPTYYNTRNVILPQDSVLDFNGKEIKEDGTYYYHGQSQYGCDSIEVINVHYMRTYFQRHTAEICYENRPYEWNGRQYYESVTDTIRYKSVLGLDSLVEIKLIVHDEVPRKTVHVSLCHGEVYHINSNVVITSDGIYMDTIRSYYGCDSITKYIVNYYPEYSITINDTICTGEYYELDGRKLTGSGDYIARLKTVEHGCDSIVRLHLVVNPAKYEEENLLLTADQLPYIYNGVLYKQEGVYENISATQNGCEDVYRLTISLTDRYSAWQQRYLCGQNDTIFLYGDTITRPGQYQFARRSTATGLIDSLARYEITRAPVYEYDEAHTICQGDSVVFGPFVYKASGQYKIRLTTVNGCDSVINLSLTVNPVYNLEDRVIIPSYEVPYFWNGRLYYETGHFKEEYATIHGCDSIRNLNLLVLPTDTIETEANLCSGEVYSWRGHELTQSGVYADTLCQLTSGISRIYILHLTVIEPTIITYLQPQQEYCADDTQGSIDFQYTGGDPSVYSIYFTSKGHAAGLMDVINAPYDELTGAAFTIPEMTEGKYVQPGRYSATLVLNNGVCDHTNHSVTVLIKYPSWIIEQNWGNTLSILSKEHNGGYEFSAYRWYINGNVQIDALGAHLYDNHLQVGDQIVVELTRQGESEVVPSCAFEIVRAISSEKVAIIRVTPTDGNALRIQAKKNVQYRLVSQNGTLLSEGHLNENGETLLHVPSVSGIYFVWAMSNEGETTTEKVIIY